MDHPGGVLSVLAVSSFVVMVVLLPQGITPAVLGLLATAAVTGALFVLRERRASEPLFDFKLAAAPTFWVAFAAGLVAFGALIGAVFIGQQFTQNVLGFEPLKAATMTLAMAVAMIASAPVAARLIGSIGTRLTLAAGLGAIALGFATIALTWRPGASVAWVLVGYALLGCGVGLAGTPSGRSLTASLPVRRVGMGSASADLTKDLGGAVFQAILGTLLTIAYVSYFTRAFAQLAGGAGAEARHIGRRGDLVVVRRRPPRGRDAARRRRRQARRRGSRRVHAREDDGDRLRPGLCARGRRLVLWKYPRHQAEQDELSAMARKNQEYLAGLQAAPRAARPAE